MAEIVNLTREKKRRARAQAAQTAAENRARHGRTAAEKAADARAASALKSRQDGARLPETDPK